MVYPGLYGRSRVLPVLTRFLASWSNLEAEVSFNDRAVDVIAEGLDLVFHVGTTEVAKDLISRVVSRHRVSICASPAYLALHGEPASPKELKDHTCLQFVPRGQPQPWFGRLDDGEASIFDIQPRVRFDSCLAIRDAAVDGLGILQMPDYLVDKAISENQLKRVLEANEPDPIAIFALYPSRKYLAPKVRLFIDSLVRD